MKTFEEYFFEATLRKATAKELNLAARSLKDLGNMRLYKDIDDKSVVVDDKTGDIYFTTTSGVRFVRHVKDGHAQELFSIKRAA